MGSRNGQTTTYWNEDKIQVVCGCFTGNLEEFEKQVEETHKKNNHYDDYMNYIKIVKALVEMEKK